MIHEDDPLSEQLGQFLPPSCQEGCTDLSGEGLVLDSGPMWTSLVTDFAVYIYIYIHEYIIVYYIVYLI